MRYFLIIWSALLLTLIKPGPETLGRKFYISTTDGDDNRTATEAQNPATPWRTVDKLQAMNATFSAGDSFFFKRGDVFYGSLRWGSSNGQAAKSGSEGAPYVFTSYGTGAAPVISGFQTVSGWTSLGGNKWEMTNALPDGRSTLEVVTINGTYTPKGRFPNPGATGTGLENGWLTIDSHNTNQSITDAQNPSSTFDWDNAKLVARLNPWRMGIYTVTSHSGTTLTAPIANPTSQNYTDGRGYIISDHVNTLDQQGEWYYNPSTKKLTVYSTVDPSTLTVKAATQDTLMQFYDDDYIVIDSLVVEGSNKWGVLFYSSVFCSVKNSVVRNIGEYGINAPNSATNNISVLKSQIYDIGDYGYYSSGGGDVQKIEDCDIYNVGVYPHMGVKTDPTRHSTAVRMTAGSTHSYKRNRIWNIGYMGICMVGTNSVAQSNIIHDYSFVVDDGGGIYTGGSGAGSGRLIDNNLIYNGLGAPDGNFGDKNSVGVYLEDNTQGYTVTNNNTFNISQHGLYGHNLANCVIRNNHFEGDQQSVMFAHDDDAFQEITGITFKNNVAFYRKTGGAYPYAASFWNRHDKAGITGMATASAIDSNYYVMPIMPTTNDLIYSITFLYNGLGTEVRTFHTLPEWRTYSGFDLNSKTSPIQYTYASTNDADVLSVHYNPTFKDSTITLSDYYLDPKGAVYKPGSYTLKALGMLRLMEARKYHVSSSTGNDANPGTEAQPWASINKVNSSTVQNALLPGDIVVFKRGDTWDGSQTWPLTPTKSGTAASRITYGAYGSGAKPVFTGTTTLTGWTQVGATRVFRSPAINVGALNGAATPTAYKVHMLTIDGKATPMGRYPNRNDPENDATTLDNNDGYLTVNSMPNYATSSSNYRRVIYDTDSRMDSLNWVGCQCAMKNSNYTIDTSTITHQGPDSLRVFKNTFYQQGAGYGYFIQNCPQTLNQHGEWYYNPTTKQIDMYIQTGSLPADFTIKASVQPTLIKLESDTYLDFDDLFLEGTNKDMVESVGGAVNNIRFFNPSMYNSGSTAFNATGSSVGNQHTIGFYDIDVYMIYDNAFDLRSMGNNLTLYRGKIRGTAVHPGTFASEPGHGHGVYINSGSTHLIRRLDVDSTGYNPIRATSNNVTIDSNWVHKFNLILDDGGAIYPSYQNDSLPRWVNIRVADNIIDSGFGTKYGASSGHNPFSNGVYCDDNGHNITVERNSVYKVSRYAYMFHHSFDIIARNNTGVDFGSLGMYFQKNDSNAHNIARMTIVGNILVSPRRIDNNSINLWNLGISTQKANKSGLGDIYYAFSKLDSNYYGRPTTDPNNSNNTSTTSGTWFRHLNQKIPHLAGGKNYTLQQIRDTFGYEINSRVQPITRLGASFESFTKYFANPTMDSVLYPLDSAYVDMKGVRYGPPGVKVAPFQSVFLLATGEPPPAGGNIAPVANAGSDQTVQLPFTSSTTLYPIDDAYTRFSTPTTTYNVDTLVIKKNTSNSFTRQTFVKFDLASIPNVQTATLRMYGRNTEDNIVQTPQLRRAADTWVESGVTWNNMPANGAWVANLGFNATPAWSTATVTSYVQTELTGDRIVSFALIDTLNQNKNISIHSSEGINKPELVITSNSSLQLSGANSFDSDGTLSYSWQKLSGPSSSGDLSATNIANPTISNLSEGTYVYRLTVTDDDGATATDDMSVFVGSTPANQLPTVIADASPSIITLPTSSVTLNSTGTTDPDGTISSYLWTKQSGGSASITSPTAASTTVTGLAAGSYIFRLKATDNDGEFREVDVSVTVNPAPATGPRKGRKVGSTGIKSATDKIIYVP